MTHKHCIVLAALLFVLLSPAWAQRRTEQDDDIEKYTSLSSIGVTTNTNSGILGGVVLRNSQSLPGTLFGKQQFRYLALEIVNVKHPKELSFQNSAGSRITFGKQNYLFVLRPEYGRELMFFSRHADEGISISGILAAGPSIGIEKPYLVAGQDRPSLLQGFDRAKLVPGLHVKAALSFELSAFRDNMTGLEIGFVAETFSRKIIIMPLAENRSFFTSGYVTLYFGSKK